MAKTSIKSVRKMSKTNAPPQVKNKTKKRKLAAQKRRSHGAAKT